MEGYIFDVQGVSCDSLHGLQQETGQWHAFTPVVSGNFLERNKKQRETNS